MWPMLNLVQFQRKTLFKAQTKDQLNLKTVGIGIYARSGASTVELSDDIKDKINCRSKENTLPEGLDLTSRL